MNKELEKKYYEIRKTVHAYNYALNTISFDLASKHTPSASYEDSFMVSSILSKLHFEFANSKKYQKLIDTIASSEDLTEVDKRVVYLEKKRLNESKNIPPKLVAQVSKICNLSEQAWEKAKNTNKFSVFAPHLKKIVAIQKKLADLSKAEYLSKHSYYEAFLDDFEEGMSVDKLDAFFAAVKKELVPFIKKITAIKLDYNRAILTREFPLQGQEVLSRKLIELLGLETKYYDLRTSTHPFSTSNSVNDVRLTTHYYLNDVLSNIYSVLHEAGHSMYEHQIDPSFDYLPISCGVSMGFHESQSRFYENIIGRSEVFTSRIHKLLKEIFPSQMEDITERDLYLAANEATMSLIRIEADELTYVLHILVRYDLEKRIVEGANINELPKLWNQLYKDYLGLEVPSDSKGILQDVHWSSPSFGYFPTYALGSAYGAQILAYMSKEIDMQKLDLQEINAYLKDKIHKYGALYSPSQLFLKSFGEEFNPKYYIDYLIKKYSGIYNV